MEIRPDYLEHHQLIPTMQIDPYRNTKTDNQPGDSAHLSQAALLDIPAKRTSYPNILNSNTEDSVEQLQHQQATLPSIGTYLRAMAQSINHQPAMPQPVPEAEHISEEPPRPQEPRLTIIVGDRSMEIPAKFETNISYIAFMKYFLQHPELHNYSNKERSHVMKTAIEGFNAQLPEATRSIDRVTSHSASRWIKAYKTVTNG